MGKGDGDAGKGEGAGLMVRQVAVVDIAHEHVQRGFLSQLHGSRSITHDLFEELENGLLSMLVVASQR